MSETRRIWKVSLLVTGIKDRDKTIKTHTIDLCEFPDTGGPFGYTVSNELIQTRMRVFKLWTKAHLRCIPMVITPHYAETHICDARAVKLELKRPS